MDENQGDKRLTDHPIDTAQLSQRRSFLKALSGGVFGATVVAAGIGRTERAEASGLEPLWNSAQVFIGNSPTDQIPGPSIECPLFFANGHFANASHALDLSNLQTGQVTGTITYHSDTIEPDFGSSIAVAVTVGSDAILYLLVAGEGTVTGGTGYFSDVTRAIIRCKYKVVVGPSNALLLIACVDCVVILVRN